MTSFSNRQLKVKTKTWARDSYGLYDYETTTLNVQNFTVTGPCVLNRVQNEVTQTNPLHSLNTEAMDEPKSAQNGATVLGSIYDDKEGIKIMPPKSQGEGYENAFWQIIERGEHANGYMLKINDVIRLGRVVFRINQIKVIEDEYEKTNGPNQKQILESIKAHMKNEINGEEVLKNPPVERMSISNMCCKICLSETEELDDPMITPCDCTGSVKYVHLKCIQNWVKSKLNMQQNKNIVTIFWKNLYCELCKKKFPLNITHHGQELSLIPIGNKISGSYVVIESFSKEKDSTGIHLIDLSSNQDFKMGRGHDCDLKIPDISVSRVHALLVVSKGKLYLKDNLSKFGTLVLHKGPLLVNDDIEKTCWVQCGRTILKFAIKKPFFSFLPCFGSLFGLDKIPAIGKFFGEDKGQQREQRLTQDGEEIRLNQEGS